MGPETYIYEVLDRCVQEREQFPRRTFLHERLYVGIDHAARVQSTLKQFPLHRDGFDRAQAATARDCSRCSRVMSRDSGQGYRLEPAPVAIPVAKDLVRQDSSRLLQFVRRE